MKISNIAGTCCLAVGVSPAFAQDYSLDLYGRANITAEHQTLGQYSVDGIFNNNSRVGLNFLANDLGDDLTLGIILEAGFNIDTGRGQGDDGQLFFNRQSEINISGSWGMIRAGMFFSESYYASADYISMHNHDTGSSDDALYVYVMRDSNKIAYRTPTWNGFTAEIAYSFPETPKPNSDADAETNAFDVALRYELTDWTFGWGYAKNDDNYQTALRASYLSSAWNVGAYGQYVDLAGDRFQTYRLAVMNIQGKNEFHVNLGYANRRHGYGAMQWTVGINHNFNNLTKVYVMYSEVLNQRNATYQYYKNGDLESLQYKEVNGENVLITGSDFSAFAIGLRRNF